MLIGYARVSTGEQDTVAQTSALKIAGCEVIFSEKASGGRWDRPELHKLLGQLRKNDVLVVWTTRSTIKVATRRTHDHGTSAG